MTPDWHLPVAAILDYCGLTGITLVGISLGRLPGHPRGPRTTAADADRRAIGHDRLRPRHCSSLQC
jgi:hypothetical protein